MKKYQIRNVDSEGCGSFYYVEVADDSTNTEIEERIAMFLTEKKENHIDQKVHHASFVGGIILAECYRIEKELNIAHDLYM